MIFYGIAHTKHPAFSGHFAPQNKLATAHSPSDINYVTYFNQKIKINAYLASRKIPTGT